MEAISPLNTEECDINTLNTDGESFLHIACKNGHLNCVKTLEIFYRYITDFKSTKDAQNSFGDTALHLACYGKSLNIVRILLEMKSSTNIPNKKGETAQNIPLNEDGDCLLHIACQWGDVDIVRYLVSDQRCVLTIQNTYLNTPLHIACYRKNLSIIRFFLKRKCSTIIPNMKGETAQDIPLNEDGDSLLHIACQWGDVDIVRYLITDERCNPNVKNYTSEDTPLHIAVKCGQDDRVVQLLSYKECNPNVQNKRGDTPLHVAAKYGEADTIVQLLSYKECNPNVQNNEGDTPLHIAAKHNMTPAISQLLTIMQCNVQNKDGDTPLHLAASSSKTAVISKLLAHQQYDINAQNKKGNTPLHLACYKRSLDVVKVLLTKRCSTNISNKKGETAQDIPLNEDGDSLLHIACQWGDVDIVRYLITDERCNPNVKNYTSEDTPLHIAVKCGQDDRVVQLLSYKECNPNVQNKEGDTPLHIAAKHNMSTPAISQLLANMQCNVQNKKGDTALHTACYSKSLDSIKLLLTKRCSTNIPNKKGETAQDIPLNEDGDCLLHIACQWGDVDIVRYLITDEECNPNVQSSTSENTPLHIASKRKSLGIIKFLLEMRCSTNIPNKKGETAQDIPLNEDGDCLLHIACQWGDVDIVRYLITDERCNPNVQSYTSKNTPLHIAAKYGQDDTIVQLLSYKECNPNAQNKEGDTPLHFAVRQSKSAAIFQLLAHQQCNPNVQNKEGDTPLHIACCQKSLHIIKLLLGGKCSTNVSNKKGETAQDIPLNGDGDCLLHIACQWGDVDIVKYLITDERFNPNIQSSTSENTPLHIAAVYGHDNTIAKLLSYKECDPNVQNEEGDTCLHVAVRQSRTTAISQLLAHLKCDPNVQNKVGDTPLHIAVWFGHDNTIVELLSCKKCNPNVQNNEGDTPLHIIVKTDKLNRCVLMITDTRCNVNILNNDHLTPLLIAIKHNNATIATALLQYKCDATLCDSHGNTPLHRACIGGETHPEMVEVAKQLLTLTGVDPSCVNNAGQTPIELTTNYQLIQAISHIVKCKTKQSVQTYINMFVVGNPETGKSTLVKAICKEATSVLWRIIPKKVRRVKNVPLHTAGIIPTTFRSKTFGNTVLYDLAGQVEYYTSHAAVIQSTVISTPPAFIVVVNLSESDEKISQTLRYWWSFIDNHAARSSSPPQVILVGSHADVVKLTGRNAQEKMTNISALLEKLSASFHFAGQVALDCRDPASRELQHFCSLVIQSCTVLRQKADVDLRCHVLYAFLLDRFKGKVTCTISDVATSVKENRELLPQDSTSLIPLISTLSDRGLLFLVKGGENHGNWWIILQKESLFGEINGVVFAPKDFSQHKDLSWSTGVVPFSKLKTEFPDYNQNMVSEFLIHLEFCFKIEDHQTLALLKNEATNVEDTSPDASEDYYFFPALVSVENPLHVWEENDAMCCECGWLYKCIRHDQFLTTQFLHVLILRLAFTFALKLNPGDCREDSLALRRKCSVWKHGIAWLNGTPIETVVEVGLQYQSVIVMMRYPKGKEVECIQLRSEIIQKTLEAKDKHCKAVEMSESFLHPTNVKYPLTDNIEDVKFYSLTEIGRVTVKREENALDQRGRNPIPVEDLLLFDPYSSDTSTELLRELFGRTHTMDETVRRQVLETLNSECTRLYSSLCITQ